jgi:hypothetical protein
MNDRLGASLERPLLSEAIALLAGAATGGLLVAGHHANMGVRAFVLGGGVIVTVFLMAVERRDMSFMRHAACFCLAVLLVGIATY